MNKKSIKMVALLGFVLPALCASASFAADVHWKRIVGVISAPDDFSTPADEHINNPVGNIASGTFPWTVRSGHAHVNLSTGAVSFEVHGLVIVGQIFSGTPGPITKVVGTLVCNPGDATQATLDTPDVPLNVEGDTGSFSGTLQNIPATCASPLFLVRIASIQLPNTDPDAADGLWIATGAERDIRN
jgi:hypothetical protein